MSEEIKDLVTIMQALYQAEQAKLQEIQREEQLLRDQATELDDLHRTAQAQYETATLGQRVYGGDVLWQAWISRSRRTLQMELAQVLVRKGQMVEALRLAHARKSASETVQDAVLSKQKQALLQREIAQEQNLQLTELADRRLR